MNLPTGIARREVIDKTKHLTPKEEVYTFLHCKIVILEGKLKHECFLLPHETFEGIQEQIDIYKRLLKEI